MSPLLRKTSMQGEKKNLDLLEEVHKRMNDISQEVQRNDKILVSLNQQPERAIDIKNRIYIGADLIAIEQEWRPSKIHPPPPKAAPPKPTRMKNIKASLAKTFSRQAEDNSSCAIT